MHIKSRMDGSYLSARTRNLIIMADKERGEKCSPGWQQKQETDDA